MKTKNKRIKGKRTLKKRGGGGNFSRVKQPSDKKEQSNKDTNSDDKISRIRFNETVKKRKSYEDKYDENNKSDDSEEEDIIDEIKTKRGKNKKGWSNKIKYKNEQVLNRLIIAKEKAHDENWTNYTKKNIDRSEYYRRKEEIMNQVLIGGNKKGKTRKKNKK
jgi:hypothetical protein